MNIKQNLVSIIVAMDAKNLIGNKNSIPWHIPGELARFRRITMGKPIIMGRKTWDSLPLKPLPNRRNIVISYTQRSDVESYTSIESCINSLNNDCTSELTNTLTSIHRQLVQV